MKEGVIGRKEEGKREKTGTDATKKVRDGGLRAETAQSV
jgi:hypothetical protein